MKIHELNILRFKKQHTKSFMMPHSEKAMLSTVDFFKDLSSSGSKPFTVLSTHLLCC